MRVTCRLITEVICEASALPVRELFSDRRDRDLVRWRHIAWYLAKTMTEFSFPHIARNMGGKDHTTVLHGVRRITASIADDPQLRIEIENLGLAVEMTSISVEKLKAGFFTDIDAVEVAERVLNAKIRDIYPSLDEIRALAMGVSHYASELELVQHQLELANRTGESEAPAMIAMRLGTINPASRPAEVNEAIDSVIAATIRMEQEQYTQGEYRAAASLFEAVKKLRRAVQPSNQYQHAKAKSND